MRQEYIDDKHKNVERGELKFGVPTPYREKADEWEKKFTKHI